MSICSSVSRSRAVCSARSAVASLDRFSLISASSSGSRAGPCILLRLSSAVASSSGNRSPCSPGSPSSCGPLETLETGAAPLVLPGTMSTIAWNKKPTSPPYPADSPAPSPTARSSLYPRSTKFWAVFCASSCTASTPPVAAALATRFCNPLTS